MNDLYDLAAELRDTHGLTTVQALAQASTLLHSLECYAAAYDQSAAWYSAIAWAGQVVLYDPGEALAMTDADDQEYPITNAERQ